MNLFVPETLLGSLATTLAVICVVALARAAIHLFTVIGQMDFSVKGFLATIGVGSKDSENDQVLETILNPPE